MRVSGQFVPETRPAKDSDSIRVQVVQRHGRPLTPKCLQAFRRSYAKKLGISSQQLAPIARAMSTRGPSVILAGVVKHLSPSEIRRKGEAALAELKPKFVHVRSSRIKPGNSRNRVVKRPAGRQVVLHMG